jgi:light-regulated signal transduction histidine kinase (bacteriophytochrome)
MCPTNYIDIKSVSSGSEKLVKQDLKFRTGKFVWRIKFTAPLNASTVNNNNLYVTNSSGGLLDTSIHYDEENHVIEIEPRASYTPDELYTLNVTKRVESKGGQRLKEEVQIKFNV